MVLIEIKVICFRTLQIFLDRLFLLLIIYENIYCIYSVAMSLLHSIKIIEVFSYKNYSLIFNISYFAIPQHFQQTYIQSGFLTVQLSYFFVSLVTPLLTTFENILFPLYGNRFLARYRPIHLFLHAYGGVVSVSK